MMTWNIKCIYWTYVDIYITKTHPFKYIENFTTKKNEKIQIKNSDIFHISAKNIDRGYSLETPRRGGSNEYQQSMFWAEIWKILGFFNWFFFIFWW